MKFFLGAGFIRTKWSTQKDITNYILLINQLQL